jgi:hypothetical protein
VLSKSLWLPALVVFSLAVPATVRAQEMGGEEKKDEPKPEEPKKEEPKPEEPKKEEPKAEGKKTLAFEAKPESFKEDKGGRGAMKHAFKLEAVEGEQDAGVVVLSVGQTDYEKEKDRWVKAFEDKDGKKLEKSAIKEEAFEANGVKGKVAEVTGNFTARARGKKKGEEQPAPEKKWTKVINIYLEGPDGGWILRLQGGEKTVDKLKEDFMKYAKSVKIVEKTGEDTPKRKKKET